MNQLLDSGLNLSDDLAPIHHRLVQIKRELGAIGARTDPDKISDIRPYQDELRSIDSKRVDGKFMAPDGSIPPGQAQVIGLLEECYEDAHEIIASQNNVSETLKPIYDRLIELKASLERLALTHRWTSRETDLWTYQLQLSEIDNMRKDGKFYDDEGNVPEGQTVRFLKSFDLFDRFIFSIIKLNKHFLLNYLGSPLFITQVLSISIQDFKF